MMKQEKVEILKAHADVTNSLKSKITTLKFELLDHESKKEKLMKVNEQVTQFEDF